MSRGGASVLHASSGGSGVSGSCGLEGRLVGVGVPVVRLPFAVDEMVSLADLARAHSLVVFFYPGVAPERDGEEDLGLARLWGWREHDPQFFGMGYRVVGVSTQSPEAQMQFALNELLGCTLLSDSDLLLADELGLPRMMVAGRLVYEPLTMVVRRGRIARVFYPVDPARDAVNVANWIKAHV
jgi:peroxiredoxin